MPSAAPTPDPEAGKQAFLSTRKGKIIVGSVVSAVVVTVVLVCIIVFAVVPRSKCKCEKETVDVGNAKEKVLKKIAKSDCPCEHINQDELYCMQWNFLVGEGKDPEHIKKDQWDTNALRLAQCDLLKKASK